MCSRKYEALGSGIIFILDKIIHVWVDTIWLRKGNRRSGNGNDSEYCYFWDDWKGTSVGAYGYLRELIEFY